MSFKHTRQLLGDTSGLVVPDDVKERRKFYDAVAAQLNALQSLKQHPGHQMLVQELQDEELLVIDRLETCKDHTDLAKTAGVLLAIRSYKTWVDDRIAELADVLGQQGK